MIFFISVTILEVASFHQSSAEYYFTYVDGFQPLHHNPVICEYETVQMGLIADCKLLYSTDKFIIIIIIIWIWISDNPIDTTGWR